jgi:hypothetical protein
MVHSQQKHMHKQIESQRQQVSKQECVGGRRRRLEEYPVSRIQPENKSMKWKEQEKKDETTIGDEVL